MNTDLLQWHYSALNAAIIKANAEIKRKKSPAAAERAEDVFKGLLSLRDYITTLEDRIAELSAPQGEPPEGADHPFAAFTYMSDTGPVQLYHTAADDRLRVVPALDAQQCEVALRVDGLQVVVRKALERRLRALNKAGTA